jgi:uncharacterized delta-60 repeat protein
MKRRNYKMISIKNKIKVCFVIAVTLVFINPANAQGDIEWVKHFNYSGEGNNTVNDMAIDGSGDIYVAGKFHDTLAAYVPGIIKYNSAGVPQWAREMNSLAGYIDEIKAIAIDYSGNIYVTGRVFSVTDGHDIFTSKLNPAGNILWTKKYSSDNNSQDCGNDIAVDNSGNVYVTGEYENFSNSRIITIKYGTDGTLAWTKIYTANPGSGIGYAILVNGTSVYVAGTDNGNGVCFKYNTDGVEQWIKTYNGGGVDEAKFIALDQGGNVLVAGNSILTAGMNDYFVIKYNSTGTQQWLRYYNGDNDGDDKVTALKVDLKNNVYLTGSSVGLSNNNDFATVKFNSFGSLKWVAKFNGADNRHDDAGSMALDYQGNVYVTGTSLTVSSGTDIATVKYDSTGAQKWLNTYSSSATSTDIGTRVMMDNSGSLIVSGGTTINNKMNFCTIKYTAVQGINITSAEIPNTYSLSQNYPNPFNPVTNINFSIPKNGSVRLAVYDITGREIALLVNEDLRAGAYKYDFDASLLSSGTYFYRMTAEGYSEVKKMILVK